MIENQTIQGRRERIDENHVMEEETRSNETSVNTMNVMNKDPRQILIEISSLIDEIRSVASERSLNRS